MGRRSYRPPDDFSRTRSYREWFEERYLAPAQRVRERHPAAYTLLLILAAIVFIFVCSVPCLIFGRLLYRLIMGT